MRDFVDTGEELKFKPNRIVGFLLDNSEVDLDKLWQMHSRQIFTDEEMKEFHQLLGCSVCAYKELFGDDSA